MNLSKKDFNINRGNITLEEQKKINKLIKESSSEFCKLEKRINSDNLIYEYKTLGRSLRDFRNYHNLIKLSKD